MLDDLRLALLIAGIVVVAAIYGFARLSRRKSARREEAPDLAARVPRDEADAHDDGASLDPASFDSASLDSASFDPTSFDSAPPEDATGTGVGDLDGVFAARRETTDAELSVDVAILEGLRATWESTLDGGTIEGTIEGTIKDSAPSAQPAPSTRLAPSADSGDTEPLAVDMSRPLVYLTLVSRQERVPGQVILDALGNEGFRPGMLQLYYWRTSEEPSITFGVANMVEPGVLDPDELPGMETPGLVTFMSVPKDTASAFRRLDTMVAVSRRLARRIDATLCDETRSTLTAQAENHLREMVADVLRRDRT